MLHKFNFITDYGKDYETAQLVDIALWSCMAMTSKVHIELQCWSMLFELSLHVFPHMYIIHFTVFWSTLQAGVVLMCAKFASTWAHLEQGACDVSGIWDCTLLTSVNSRGLTICCSNWLTCYWQCQAGHKWCCLTHAACSYVSKLCEQAIFAAKRVCMLTSL